jgi:putative SOS response-associated peptidase YedK
MRELMEQFSVTGIAPESSLPLNWNIAPTNPIYIVRANDKSGSDAGQQKELAVVSWGLIGPWLTDFQEARASQSRAINARSESIHEKPTFRNAFRATR